MKIHEIAFRNIRRNMRRSLLSMTAIMIAAMSIVMLFSLLAGMKSDLNYNIKSFYTGQVRVRNKDFDKNELLNPLHLRVENYKEVINTIMKVPEVSLVSPRISFPGLADPNDQNKGILGVGVDFEIEKKFQNIEEYIIDGRVPKMGTTEILIGGKLANELGLSVGDKLTVTTTTMRRSPNAVTFTITGLITWPVSNMNIRMLYAPLDKIQHITRLGDSASELLIKFKTGTSDKEAKALIQKAIKPYESLSAKTWLEVNTMASFMYIAEVMYTIIAFFFFALASTVIINTTMMVIFERMREIGTIAAMGMKGKEIVRLFFTEAFYLAFIGSAIGVIIGIGLTYLLGKTGIDYTQTMEGIEFEVSSIIYPKLDIRSTIGTFFYSLAVASAASILPTRRAAKIEPVEALRHVG